MDTNLQQAAALVASIAGIQPSEDPQKTLEEALSKLHERDVLIEQQCEQEQPLDEDNEKCEKDQDAELDKQALEENDRCEKDDSEDKSEKDEVKEEQSEAETEEDLDEQYDDTFDESEWIGDNTAEQLNEDELYQTYRTAGPIYNIKDYLIRKYAGIPSVRDWAEIWQTDHNMPPGVPQVDDVTPEEEYDWSYANDTDFDRENGISYQDISDYLDDMTVDDYLATVYDDDDIDFDYVDDDDDEFNRIVNDPDYCTCKQYSDQMLNDACAFAEQCKANARDPEELIEALTMSQRLRRALKMRARAAKIAARRKIVLKIRANMKTIVQRARKLAIRMLKAKYSNGTPLSDLTYADRDRLEKIISNRKNELDVLSRKMIPVVRRIEQKRFARGLH